MRVLRTVMGWVFGISLILCILGEYQFVLTAIQILKQHAYTSWNLRTWLLVLFCSAIPPLCNITFGVAWWTNWRGTISARGWGIAASLTFFLVPLWFVIHDPKSILGVFGVELAIGTVGLVAFSRRIEIKPKSDDPKPEPNSN
jgi:hypothetical protein